MSQYMIINTQFFVAGLLAGMAPGGLIVWLFVKKAINKQLKDTIKGMIDESVIYYFQERKNG